VAPGVQPTPNGSLGIALPRAPGTFDPLLASTQADQLVAGQIYEPLVETLSGPYGVSGHQPGLALAVEPAAHETIWRLRLRPGVRFQDGARFNASAVLENADRWRTTVEGQALLPGLVAADAPSPNLVRFIFDVPDPNLPRQLASVRLGVVSPRALRSPEASTRLTNGLAPGTGPFQVHSRGARRLLLARNPNWWGTRHDLGPAVELVELRFASSADQRLALLRRGTVQVAEGLGASQAARLRRDPLLTDLAGPGGTVTGLERSVRGFGGAQAIPPLSGVWLTTVGTGAG
jgi:peptide/nickel transport system substrate-binding protein